MQRRVMHDDAKPLKAPQGADSQGRRYLGLSKRQCWKRLLGNSIGSRNPDTE